MIIRADLKVVDLTSLIFLVGDISSQCLLIIKNWKIGLHNFKIIREIIISGRGCKSLNTFEHFHCLTKMILICG